MPHGPSVLDQLRDIPPLRVMEKTIDAACYNQVRIALRRIGTPLHIELDRPQLVMLLDEAHWVAVPPWDPHLPVLAWSGFARDHREALHEDVHCELRLFDIRSGLVMRTALDALQTVLRARLAGLN